MDMIEERMPSDDGRVCEPTPTAGVDAEVAALRQLADQLPKVARSVPAELAANARDWQSRSLTHCLLPAAHYDRMLGDSLTAVDELQQSLDALIDTVRSSASTPAAGGTPVPARGADASASATVQLAGAGGGGGGGKERMHVTFDDEHGRDAGGRRDREEFATEMAVV